MEAVKRPEVVVSLSAALAVVGLGIYSIKRFNDLSEKIDNLTDDLTKIAKKQGEVKPSDIQNTKANLDSLVETMRRVDGVIKNLYETVNEIQDNEDENNEQLQEFIDACSTYLESKEKGINLPTVELSYNEEPEPTPVRGRRGAKNKSTGRSSKKGSTGRGTQNQNRHGPPAQTMTHSMGNNMSKPIQSSKSQKSKKDSEESSSDDDDDIEMKLKSMRGTRKGKR